MRRKVVDATKAWRMRRTRGDIGRRLLFAAAARAAAVPVFLAGDLLPAALAGFAAVVEGFVCADLGDEDFVGADGFWPLDAGAPDFLSGGSDVAGELCWRSEDVAEGVPLRSPHSPPSASTHHHLRPNRPTLLFQRGDANARTCPEIFCKDVICGSSRPWPNSH